jgi:hypothetical protein
VIAGIRSCLPIGVQRGGPMHLNPIDGEEGLLRPGDDLIALSRAAPDPSLLVPAEPSPPIEREAARGAESAR